MIAALVDAGISKKQATAFVASNYLDPAIQTAMDAHDHAETVALANNLPGGLDPAIATAIKAKAYPDGPGQPNDPNAPVSPPPSANPEPAAPPIDWHAYLSDWGFDTNMMNELDRIFKVYSDPTQAAAAGLAYIRGTDWYSQHFAGIGDAIRLGLVSDEQGYRSYLNDANQYFRRFYGRDITTGELVDFFHKGYTSQNIGQHLKGEGAVKAETPDIQYALGAFSDNTTQATTSELGSYGDQVGGLDNLVGQQLQAKLDKAKARLNAVFQGTLGTPALNVVNGRLTSPSLAGGTTVGDVPS